MEPKGNSEQFYRYTDSDGRVHIVQSLQALPPEARSKAELVLLNSELSRRQQVLDTAPRFELDGRSFFVGAGAALLLVLVFRLLPQGLRWVWRLALVAALAALGTGLYLGYLRRATGLGSSALSTPSALIQDAKKSVEKVQQAERERDAELRAIENEK